jgi:hypothetical protein
MIFAGNPVRNQRLYLNFVFRLARTLLQNMSKESVTKQLNVATKNQCRSALHLAVMTGDLCQVRVLLEFGEFII